MPYGVHVAYGARRVLDRYQETVRSSHKVYLRLRNFSNIQNELWAQLGFAIAPTGTPTGTVDIEVTPWPSTKIVSMHDIGMSGGKLRIGARTFCISHTFVLAQQKARNLDQTELVWTGPDVVGIVLDNRLFDIVIPDHEEISGQTVEWVLTCNATDPAAGAATG